MNRPTVRGDRRWEGEGPRHASRRSPAGGRSDAELADDEDVLSDAADDDYPDDDEYDEYDEYGEYEVLRPESTTGRRVLTVLIGIGLVLALVAIGTAAWVRGQLDPGGSPGAEITVTVPIGSSTAAIADILEEEGVIPNAQAFRYYLRFKGHDGFQAGDYVFRQNIAARDAVAVLLAGPALPTFQQFTIPEGLTLSEIPQRIADNVAGFSAERIAELLASGQVRPASLPPDVADLEGFLFPDTYRVEEGQTELDALMAMAAQFDAVAAELGLADAANRVGLTPYEVVVGASLIQEEAANAAEMPMIARVIYNRLDDGIPLGIDAALCYGLDKSCTELTRSDLEGDNPYNTRVVAGLPPTPIASPGREALAAMLAPADGPWLYYVRDPEVAGNGHMFTDDYREFLEAKERCEAAGLGCG